MMSLNSNTIRQGDVLGELKKLPDECIDCIVTSPPYYGLRDYGTAIWKGGKKNCDHKIPEIELDKFNKNNNSHTIRFNRDKCYRCGAKRIDQQVGLEGTLNEYLEKMLQITAELKRVLKATGVIFWNHGDSYGGSGLGLDYSAHTKGKNSILTDKTLKAMPRVAHTRGKYEKCLLLQAHRLAIRMIDEQGWIMRNQIIWHKSNCMPSSVKDRFTVDFEPVFFFSKSKKYYFEPQYEPYAPASDVRYRQALRAGRSYNTKKPYKNNTPYSGRYKRGQGSVASRGDDADGLLVGGSNPLGRNKRCVWRIPTKPFPEAHFAVFPEALIETPIKAGCPEMICKNCGKAREKIWEKEYTSSPGQPPPFTRSQGKKFKGKVKGEAKYATRYEVKRNHIGYTDCGCKAGWHKGVVLDPFIGAGTTAVVAKKLGRNYVGIELNPEYIKIAEKRLNSITTNNGGGNGKFHKTKQIKR